MERPDTSDAAATDPQPQRRAIALVLLLAAVYLGICLPITADTLQGHGDERYYSDAAIEMLRTGDYWTPRYEDGSLRFKKPILAYWFVAASFRVFGVSPLTARLPFVITGVGVVAAAFAMALGLWRRTDAAVVAAAVMASNVALYEASARSTPDVLIGLFIPLSLYGFVRLAAFQDFRARNYFLAYGGAGLAVAAKGLLGVMVVALVFLYCAVRARRGAAARPRRLLHAPSMAAGAAIALFWFVAVIALHGRQALDAFVVDQVVEETARFGWRYGANFLAYLVAPVSQFLPWLLLLIPVALYERAALRRFAGAHREAFLLMAAWHVVLCVVFAGGNKVHPRYIFPEYALLACGLAGALTAGDCGGRAEGVIRRAELLLIGLGGAGGTVALATIALIQPRLLTGAVVCAAGASGLFLATRRSGRAGRAVALGVAVLASYGMFDLIVRPVFSATSVAELARRIETLPSPPDGIAVVHARPDLANHLRLHLGDRIPISRFPESTSWEVLRAYRVVVWAARDGGAPMAPGYAVTEWGYAYKPKCWNASTIRDLIGSSDKTPVWRRMRTPRYMAVQSDGLNDSR